MAQVSICWTDLCNGNATEEDWKDLREFMLNTAREFLGDAFDPELVEDSVQDLVVKLHDETKLRQLTQAASPERYLRKMVKNDVIDQMRSQRSYDHSLHEYAERIVQSRRRLEDPVQSAIQKERVEELLHAIRTLSEVDQDLIHSFHIDGDSIGELATRHGLSESNVTTRLGRARQRLLPRLKH